MFSMKSGQSFFGGVQPEEPSGPTASSIIGAEVTIRGDLETGAALLVEGIIEGNLTCQSVVQTESSRIEGTLSAKEDAQLAGSVKGAVTARNLVIRQTARIEGEVNYETLVVERGALVEGKMLRTEPAPAKALSLRAVETVPAEKDYSGKRLTTTTHN